MGSVLNFASGCMIPVLIFFIVGYGIASRVNVYEEFIAGAKDGLKTVVGILPTLIGLIVATGILRTSGIFEILGKIMEPVTLRLGIVPEMISLVFVKMFSSSAATSFLLDIYKTYGTDSFAGFASSLILSSTETIFYCMSVYFVAARVTKSRYTFAGAMMATMAGVVASIVLAGMV